MRLSDDRTVGRVYVKQLRWRCDDSLTGFAGKPRHGIDAIYITQRISIAEVVPGKREMVSDGPDDVKK